jgi:hypothetical protein
MITKKNVLMLSFGLLLTTATTAQAGSFQSPDKIGDCVEDRPVNYLLINNSKENDLRRLHLGLGKDKDGRYVLQGEVTQGGATITYPTFPPKVTIVGAKSVWNGSLESTSKGEFSNADGSKLNLKKFKKEKGIDDGIAFELPGPFQRYEAEFAFLEDGKTTLVKMNCSLDEPQLAKADNSIKSILQKEEHLFGRYKQDEEAPAKKMFEKFLNPEILRENGDSKLLIN